MKLLPHDNGGRFIRLPRYHWRLGASISRRLVYRGPARGNIGGALPHGHEGEPPRTSEDEIAKLHEAVFRPLENYRIGRNEIVAGIVSPNYIAPIKACSD